MFVYISGSLPDFQARLLGSRKNDVLYEIRQRKEKAEVKLGCVLQLAVDPFMAFLGYHMSKEDFDVCSWPFDLSLFL